MSMPWPKVSLGELLRLERRPVEVEADKDYEEIGIYCFGRGIFRKRPRSGLEVGDKDLFLLREGDFILQVTFAWEGAIALVSKAEEGLYGSTRYPTFRVDESRCDPRFLLHYFKTHEGLEQLIRICPGSAGRNRVLSIKRIPEVLVPLPPLAEQRRVVARIEELAAQIHEAHALRQQTTEEADVLLVSFRRAVFGEVPKPDWIPLSNYVEAIVNGKSPATEGRRAASDEWAVLKVGAVSFGVFDDQANKALPISYVVPPSMEVRPGDFIMSRANTVELVGACALVRETRPKLMLSDKTFRFVFSEPHAVLPEYMEQVLKSLPLREQIERGASGTSPTMKNISKEKVLGLRLPPFTLSEQRIIVAELDALQAEVNALKRLQAETAVELDALLPAILDRAFKGELTYGAEVIALQTSPEFLRAVLAAEIVSEMHASGTFGQTKLQKVIYLAEYVAELCEIDSRPRRFARGPHDPALMEQVERKMRESEWFKTVGRDGHAGKAYAPLENAGEHRVHFERQWPDQASTIRRVISLMKSWKTERCERLATVYAAWNDLLHWNHAVNDQAILYEVLKRWHPKKLNIPRVKWQETLDWMRANDIVPRRFGHATTAAPQPELLKTE